MARRKPAALPHVILEGAATGDFGPVRRGVLVAADHPLADRIKSQPWVAPELFDGDVVVATESVVVAGDRIAQGAAYRADDPLVLEHPSLFEPWTAPTVDPMEYRS